MNLRKIFDRKCITEFFWAPLWQRQMKARVIILLIIIREKKNFRFPKANVKFRKIKISNRLLRSVSTNENCYFQ